MLALIFDVLGSYFLIQKTSRWRYLIPIGLLLGIASSFSTNLAMHYIWPDMFPPSEAAMKAVIGSVLHPIFCVFCIWWFRRKKLRGEPALAQFSKEQLEHSALPKSSSLAIYEGKTVRQLRRLTWLVMVILFVGFFVAACYSFYSSSSSQSAVTSLYELLNKSIVECEKDRDSVYCPGIMVARSDFNSAVERRNAHDENARSFVLAAIVGPVLSGCLFICLGWLVTGSRPRLFVRSTGVKVEK